MENNKNKKSVKFQVDMLNFCDFIQVFVFTRNHHLNLQSNKVLFLIMYAYLQVQFIINSHFRAVYHFRHLRDIKCKKLAVLASQERDLNKIDEQQTYLVTQTGDLAFP